jgi:hypothetical protein
MCRSNVIPPRLSGGFRGFLSLTCTGSEPIMMVSFTESVREKARKHWEKRQIEPIAPISPILGDT